MAQRRDADLIILGGGLAGLSLAAHLARSGSRHAVRIVEPREHYAETRSWCFWGPGVTPLSAFVARRWPAWSVAGKDGAPVRHAVPGLSYQQVESGPVFSALTDRLRAAPHIRLDTGITAHEVSETPAGLAVETSAGRLVARHVVDTRPPRDRGIRRPVLFQCFAGREMHLPAGTRQETGCAELMTHMRAGPDGLSFDYVLPLDEARARVEAVRWSFSAVSRSELEGDLERLIERRGGTGTGPIGFGVLPTGLPLERAPRRAGLYRAAIGTGGWRAGAGQALFDIEAWAGACSARLMAGAGPVSYRESSPLQRALTAITVAALARRPEAMDAFVLDLAHRLPPRGLIRVMSARAGFRDGARLLAALPAGMAARSLLARSRGRT